MVDFIKMLEDAIGETAKLSKDAVKYHAPTEDGLLPKIASVFDWITSVGSFLPGEWGETLNHAKSFGDGTKALLDMVQHGVRTDNVSNLLEATETYFVRDALTGLGVPGPIAEALTLLFKNLTDHLIRNLGDQLTHSMARNNVNVGDAERVANMAQQVQHHNNSGGSFTPGHTPVVGGFNLAPAYAHQ